MIIPIDPDKAFTGYMIHFDAWEKAIRASDGTQLMKDMVIAAAQRIRTSEGLLDSFTLGLTLGELSNHLTPTEFADFQKTRRPGGDLNRVPYVRTPKGPVS